jgi:hypothetical protein
MENLLDDIDLHVMDEKFSILSEEVKQNLVDIYLSEELCKNVMTELNTIESIQLNYIHLAAILELVLQNKHAIHYLYNNYYYYDKYQNTKINIFKNLYDELVVEKKKNFVNLSLVNDFALSWLHKIYH